MYRRHKAARALLIWWENPFFFVLARMRAESRNYEARNVIAAKKHDERRLLTPARLQLPPAAGLLSSSALRFATATVAGGKPANSATLMPKDRAGPVRDLVQERQRARIFIHVRGDVAILHGLPLT